MSFEINWHLLNEENADQLASFLNGKLQSEPLPPYIGPITISLLHLGSIPPQVSLLEIQDPLPIFYDDEATEPPAISRSQSCSTQQNDVLEESMSQQLIQTDDSHFQVKVKVEYYGDVRLEIKTSLIVNIPTPNFISLPVVLSLHDIAFECTCITALMPPTVNICFEEFNVSNIGVDGVLGGNSGVLNDLGTALNLC